MPGIGWVTITFTREKPLGILSDKRDCLQIHQTAKRSMQHRCMLCDSAAERQHWANQSDNAHESVVFGDDLVLDQFQFQSADTFQGHLDELAVEVDEVGDQSYKKRHEAHEHEHATQHE